MKVVIIGMGPAGVAVAETLRQRGFDGEIALFAGEDFPPYAPPVLASFFETGGDTIFWKGHDFCQRHQLTCYSGVWIKAVRPAEKTIITAGGERIPYDKLVIATGSTLYAPVACHCTEPLGPGEYRFYNFKSMSAALKIRERVRGGDVKSAVIVGAGFIGSEIALLLADLGIAVTQVEMLDRVMPRVLDAETAAYAEQAMRERGIDLRLNTKAAEFRGRKMVESLILENGEVLEADMFIAATGIRPNIDFLQDSGVPLTRGVLVDDYLNAGSPDIFAAGDVAETVDLITGKRYVHALFPNAVAQGIIVADNILGYNRTYPGAETTNSLKHLGLPLIAVGEMQGDEELKVKGRDFLRKVILRDGRIVGFRLVGDMRHAGVYHSLMTKKTDVSAYKRQLLSDHFGVGFLDSIALHP